MIVLDASAAVDWLLQTSSGRRIENRVYARSEALHAPHLVDREVTQVLRRLTQQGIATRTRADEAVRDLLDLSVTRHPHLILLPRIWQLRHNVSAYEALISYSLRNWAPPFSPVTATSLPPRDMEQSVCDALTFVFCVFRHIGGSQ